MYAATVDGRPLTFEVTAVWRRNMIVRDRETGTLWQHATGEGLIGPLQGMTLTPLGGEQTVWAAWKTEHPQTTIVRAPEDWPGLIPRSLVERMLSITSGGDRLKMVPPGLHSTDRRLPAGKFVAGLIVSGVAKAFPLALLARRGVINDEVGGVPVAVLYEEDVDRIRAFDRRIDGNIVSLHREGAHLVSAPNGWHWTSDGSPLDETPARLQRLTVSRQRWLGWSEFYLDSAIYRGKAEDER